MSVANITGSENVITEKNSRNLDGPQSGNLPRSCSNRLGKPDTDLFASRINCHLLNYTSCRPDPGAKAVIALS